MFDEEHVFKKTLDRSNREQKQTVKPERIRLNPRYLFIDQNSDFGRDFYHDLLMEQQEQQ